MRNVAGESSGDEGVESLVVDVSAGEDDADATAAEPLRVIDKSGETGDTAGLESATEQVTSDPHRIDQLVVGDRDDVAHEAAVDSEGGDTRRRDGKSVGDRVGLIDPYRVARSERLSGVIGGLRFDADQLA